MDIIKVELDYRPKGLGHERRVVVVQEPVRIRYEGRRPQSRTIPLRTPPRSFERCQVDVKLGLAEPARGNGATWIIKLLECSLGTDIVVDEISKTVVHALSVLIYQHFGDQ